MDSQTAISHLLIVRCQASGLIIVTGFWQFVIKKCYVVAEVDHTKLLRAITCMSCNTEGKIMSSACQT